MYSKSPYDNVVNLDMLFIYLKDNVVNLFLKIHQDATKNLQNGLEALAVS